MNKTLLFLVLAIVVCSQSEASFSFTYPTLTTGTELITSPDSFSWIYITTPAENETKLTKVLYDKEAENNTVMYEVELEGTWQVLAINEEKLDCAILYNAEDS